MSSLAVKHLRDRRVGTVRVLNRSLERARALAERTHAEPGALEELPSALRDADLLVSATGATGVVLTEPMLRAALEGRDRSLFVLDLGVPRDVEASAREVGGVTLVDIDDLRGALAARATELVADVETRARDRPAELERFAQRRRSNTSLPSSGSYANEGTPWSRRARALPLGSRVAHTGRARDRGGARRGIVAKTPATSRSCA